MRLQYSQHLMYISLRQTAEAACFLAFSLSFFLTFFSLFLLVLFSLSAASFSNAAILAPSSVFRLRATLWRIAIRPFFPSLLLRPVGALVSVIVTPASCGTICPDATIVTTFHGYAQPGQGCRERATTCSPVTAALAISRCHVSEP